MSKATSTPIKRSMIATAMVVTLAFAAAFASRPAHAQTRAETLRYVTGAVVNTLDPTMPGSTREAFAVSLSTYDRLVSFGRKQLNGKWVFDLDNIRGELAESFDVCPGRAEDHLPSAQGCEVSGRHASHRRRREMVARSRRHRQFAGEGAIAHRLADEHRPVQGHRSRDIRSDAAEARQARAAEPRDASIRSSSTPRSPSRTPPPTIPGRSNG